MKNIVRDLMAFFFPRDDETLKTSLAVDRDSVIADLRLFLVQLAQWISDHLEYEHRVGHGLPRDSSLVFRFRLEDYVEELCEFFERKKLMEADREILFLAAIEVLLPPENVREQLPWRVRRQLFVSLLTQISDRTGIAYPMMTRSFYDHLARRDFVNNIPRTQVLESYQEAITELSRVRDREEAPNVADDEISPEDEKPTEDEQPITDEPAMNGRPLETGELIRRTLVACGAVNYTSLKKILSRKHLFELVSFVVTCTLIATATIVFARPIVSLLADHLSVLIDTTAWYALVAIVYLLLVTVRYQRFRFHSTRRRTLIRVANALAEAVDISYKEMDDVLHTTYGTTLRELKSALLPRTRK